VVGLAADAAVVEPNLPRVVRKEIALRRWPERLEGFRIALLSDFHYDPYFSVHPLRASISMVNDLRPELIVLTGDFVTAPFPGDRMKAASGAEPCANLLRQMHAAHGLWAVLGNHDVLTDADRVTSSLCAGGFRSWLINQFRWSVTERGFGSPERTTG
jgi:predicted MPP superfamily phosphohydrolase